MKSVIVKKMYVKTCFQNECCTNVGFVLPQLYFHRMDNGQCLQKVPLPPLGGPGWSPTRTIARPGEGPGAERYIQNASMVDREKNKRFSNLTVRFP